MSSELVPVLEQENIIRMLVVDDDDLVRDTYASILSDEGYEVCCASSAAEAYRALETSRFDIMLCDISMPGQNGMELMRRSIAENPDMPVVLITGNGTVDLAREALRNGASDFVTKPCNQGELPIVVERNLTRKSVDRKRTRQHQRALQCSEESVLDALLSALSTRDTETQGHSERVTAYTVVLADLLCVTEDELYHIERGALLHDIGKIGVPDRILLKPSELTPEEWKEMRRHPEIGHDMCARIPMLHGAARIVLHHHEAWDGSGYPGGLAGKQIPLGSRLFAIADSLDAMTSDRPYRPAISFREAREEIERCSGTQFDPDLVTMFLSIPEERWLEIRKLSDGATRLQK